MKITKKYLKKVKKFYPLSLAPSMDLDDNRHIEWSKQRDERGFDNTELWNLDSTFAEFMLPRIKAYLESTDNIIDRSSDLSFDKDMVKIVRSLEMLSDTEYPFYKNKEYKEVTKGLIAFAKRIQGLWY